MTNSFFRKITALLVLTVGIINNAYSSEITDKTGPSKKIYLSKNQVGQIGVSEQIPIDNPADNVFHINIDKPLRGNENVWLIYELEGVEDHNSVSRSINDQLAVGGYLVKKRSGWVKQRERINAAWLKSGDNVIRFTAPSGAKHHYQIRNLQFEIDHTNGLTSQSLVVDQTSGHTYYNDMAYIKGFIADYSSKVQVFIDGEKARLYKGEFEGVVKRSGNSQQVKVEAVFPDGQRLIKNVDFQNSQNADYTYDLSGEIIATKKLILPNQDASVSLNGASLTLTNGSLNSAQSISITSLRDVDIPALDPGMVNVTKNHNGYRFLPHKTQFLKEAQLRIAFDETKIPDGYTAQDVKTYFFDESSHHWIALPLDSIMEESGEIISVTTHFTDMINAVIKVPESPEVNAYNSNSIKDIKSANPTAAINLIEPPQANSMGNASIGYSINIPSGRNGMQPQVGISYNSGNGNGWLGLGWGLSTPFIGIDTRWGVPRYDAAKETETYLFNGEQLTPVAHRGELQDRVTGDKRFYPRVESSFSKVIRHGNNPANYWWEVTDKNGTRYFYGGDPVNGVDENATLSDANANKAHWCLKETRDLNGNFVRYQYRKVEDVGVAGGTVAGYQIYIEKITYTGYNNEEGKYAVLFKRDRELQNWRKRADVNISANLGFKQVTADLLKKIEVQFEGKNIRSYELNYKKGEFFKTLLDSISEFDASGKFFTSHKFEYYNDVTTGGNLKPFKAVENWTTSNDNINANFINPIKDIDPLKDFGDEASALSGTKSTDIGAGLAVTVGFDANVASKSTSVGGNLGYSESTSEGLLSMIDINGDGLPDKVFTTNDGMFYRPNLSGPDGTSVFGDKIAIQGINKFHKEKSKTISGGIEAHGPGAVIFAGVGASKTTSTTTVYFTEANGDQLIDVVINGTVYFNRLNATSGHPEFSPTSNGTPSPVNQDGSVANDIFEVDPAELDSAINQNPLHDVVRMWKAPFDGQVIVKAPVQLVKSDDANRNETPADGVRVAIQLKGTELWNTTIGPDDYSWHQPSGVNNLSVQKGDRIYFRVGSIANGSYDQVNWTPQIEYLNQDLNLKDANNKPLYSFSSKDDFVLSSSQEVATPIKGQVRIEGNFSKPKTSDSVLVQIVKKVNNGVEVPVWSKMYSWETEVNEPVAVNLAVENNESYSFKVQSSTNIDWSSIQWNPVMYYTASADPAIPVTGTSGESLVKFYPVPDYSIYADVISITKPWVAAVNSIAVTPQLSLPPSSLYNGSITFSVKKKDTLVAKQRLNVFNGQISTPQTFTINTSQNDTLYFEYHTNSFELVKVLDHKAVVVQAGATINVATGLHAYLDTVKNGNIIFGPLFRGWGHFAYNGNRDRATNAINENELKLSEVLLNSEPVDVGSIGDGNELENKNTYDPAKDNFIMLVALGEKKHWEGYDKQTFVTADIVSSSRLGDDDISPVQAVPGNGSGARAINKIAKSTNYSFSVGAGGGFISGSYGKSYGGMKVLTDFVDMNGDRYPDIVTEKKIQYTNALGGLSSTYIDHGKKENHKTTTESDGVSLSGSFVTSKGTASPSNAKKITFSVGTGNNSAGLSANYGKGKNEADFTWMDINGDGLPDRVKQGGMVELNLGYSFAPEEPWGYSQIQKGDSKSYGGGLGFSIWNGSISGGISLSRSDNYNRIGLQDVNGDNLADIVVEGNPMKVRLNTGSGFSEEINWLGASQINKSSAANEAANVAFTFGIYFPIVNIKICFNPSVNAGKGMTRDLEKLSDVDGDGFPDYVKSTKDNELFVSRSTIGRTNLLKGVKRPLGASFAIDYKRIGNTYEMPNDVWALSQVEVKDGFTGDGADRMLTTFDYKNGYYDRFERDFYGFKKVIVKTHDTQKRDEDYVVIEQTFNNDNFYEKGLQLAEVMQDGQGNKYLEKENQYAVTDRLAGTVLSSDAKKNFVNSAYPSLKETVQKFYEGQTDPGKSTRSSYGYDQLGNVINFTDFGDEGDQDDISSTITYHSVEDKYIMSSPKSIVVSGSNGTYRKRESSINEKGNVSQMKQFLQNGEAAVFDMEYDEYGNLTKVTRPVNAKGQRLSINYIYDNTVHSYNTKVSNSYGYSSEASYDFRFGQIINSKDMNGHLISSELDNVGRITKVTGPLEKTSPADYTIKFEYHPEATVPWALTKHYDPANPRNDLESAIFVDGLGRVLQTKKDAAIYQGENKADKEQMVVSGRVKFDAFGRIYESRYPVLENLGNIGKFNFTEDNIAPTLSSYDIMGRTLTTTLPDGAVNKTEYGFGNDRYSVKQFSIKITDANGKQTESFTDMKGRSTSVKNYTTTKDIWTSFVYNAMDEQIASTDDEGHTTQSAYDWFGRRTSRKHPDAGINTYTYDLVGNLIQLQTANLKKDNAYISYDYDFERLTNINYPQNPENNIRYVYGEAGAAYNRAGRIVLQEDVSGAQEFFYDPLGEIVKNVHTIVIPQHAEQTYVTEWKYDTWSRLTSMIYPDGEQVTFNYNAGGLLNSMNGKKKGSQYNYVKQLGYDKFEQRLFLAYGNGTNTAYSYEPDRRRLKVMTAKTSHGRIFMNNAYGYDKVNNILNLKNTAPIPAANLMGGSSEYSYDYDDMYQLTEATGLFKGSNGQHRYSLTMQYNTVGGITKKVQKHERSGGSSGNAWTEQKKTTYANNYAYGETQPHTPVHIGQQTYSYDANGNQTGWEDDKSGQRRKIFWDEENRVRAIMDNGATYHYVYDASGERVLKGQSQGQTAFVNAEKRAGSGQMGNYTVYVNPYIVLKSGGYTKHYYIEGQRILSKLGGGWDNNGKGPLKAGGDSLNYANKKQAMEQGIVKNLKFLGMDGQILTAGKSGKIPPGQINGTGNTTESFQYYFHPDHLGSTSYISDAAGEVYQHLEYFAFGETFVEEHSNTNRVPYLFNGKELDEETGLYYYGSRYMDPKTSVWLSIDRYTEKYPGYSGYSYCLNNPIVVTDPTGDTTHLVVYGAGYLNYTTAGGSHDVGKGFQLNAEALKKKIESSPTFDPARDAVILVYAPSSSRFISAVNKKYKSGKIGSLTVFSHGYGFSETNGTNTGGVSLGGEKPGERRSDGTTASQADADAQKGNYDLREINGNNVMRFDKSNFEKSAVATFYGCWIGGDQSWSDAQIRSFAFGQKLADNMGITVKALTSSGLFKTNSSGKIIYDGTMIRAIDAKSQKTRLSTFRPYSVPSIIRK